MSGLVGHLNLQSVLVLFEQHIFHAVKCQVWCIGAWNVVRFVRWKHACLGRSYREKGMASAKVQYDLTKSSQGLAVADRSGKGLMTK